MNLPHRELKDVINKIFLSVEYRDDIWKHKKPSILGLAEWLKMLTS
jgi:hypothetical protein